MNRRLLASVAIILLLFTVTSCVDDLFIKGNGIPVTESRSVPAFSSVSSEGNFIVYIFSGPHYKVTVNADENLLPYIETSVTGNNLRIHTRRLTSFKSRIPVEISVTTPSLKGIVQSGSGSITAEYFEADAFHCVVSGSGSIQTTVGAGLVDAVISGSGRLNLTGTAIQGNFAVSGSGELDAWDLSVRDCDAKISGSGDIWVDVHRYLKAVISGSGNLFYSGRPHIETVVSGSGGVIQKN